MDYQAALDSLKNLEGAGELVPIVAAELERLTAKNYDLIGENRKATAKAASLQQSLEAIASTLDLDTTDLDAATTKAKTLAEQLSTAETRATEAETKLQGLERKATIAQAAAKAGAVAEVLERLLGDRVSDLKIEGDDVKLDDKLLKEFIEGDDGLKPFLPALFPTATTPQTPPPPQLPSGTPNAQTPTIDPVAGYLNKTYKASVVATPEE